MMHFKLYHDTKKKTLALPRAALQLSALADAGVLTLHAGHGYILTVRDDLTTSECVELIHSLTSTAAGLLDQLAANSQAAVAALDSWDEAETDDPFRKLDDGFLSMLLTAGVDLDGLQYLMSQEGDSRG